MSAEDSNEGIFDGCFYVWVNVTEKYMSKDEKKKFNDYEKSENEKS